MTQGAVSRQIKLLEDWVGLALFVRQHHELVLTAAGVAFARRVGKAFEELEQGVSELQPSRILQRLRVNVPTTFASRWLAPRLSEFHQQHGYLDLQITTDVVVSPAQAQQYDCCIVFQNGPWQHGDSELLHLEEHVAVAGQNLPQAPQQLVNGQATLLHLLNNDGSRLPMWDNWFSQSDKDKPGSYFGITFSTLDQAIHAAVAGAGIALVDRLMIQKELDNATLLRLSNRTLHGPYGYWLVKTNQRSIESPEHALAAKQLLVWLRTALQAKSDESPTRR